MSGPELKGKDLTALKTRFSAWHVPSNIDFSTLIDVVSQSFSPGSGLEGGDPSTTSEVDADRVTLLAVRAGRGLAAQAGGVALAVESSMTFTGSKLTLNLPTNGGLSKSSGLAVKLNTAGGLENKAGAISLSPPGEGLKLESKLSLSVDQQTLKTNAQGVYLVCKTGGGLKIEGGVLVVDIDAVLKG